MKADISSVGVSGGEPTTIIGIVHLPFHSLFFTRADGTTVVGVALKTVNQVERTEGNNTNGGRHGGG